MPNKCDVLILTANFGTGHVAVSNTIKAQLLKKAPELDVHIIDVYKMLHPTGYKAIYRSYEMLVRKFPYFYNQYYYGKEWFKPLKRMDTLSKISIKRLHRYLEETKPSVIISTFPGCTGYMAQYKKRYHSSLPLLTCITDAVCNNEWIYEACEGYFVAD